MHTRLRAHAESVAFFGGGAREGATVAAGFDALMRHLSAVIDVRRGASATAPARLTALDAHYFGTGDRDGKDSQVLFDHAGSLEAALLCKVVDLRSCDLHRPGHGRCQRS